MKFFNTKVKEKWKENVYICFTKQLCGKVYDWYGMLFLSQNFFSGIVHFLSSAKSIKIAPGHVTLVKNS